MEFEEEAGGVNIDLYRPYEVLTLFRKWLNAFEDLGRGNDIL